MLSGFRELHFCFKDVLVWTSMGQAQLTDIKKCWLKTPYHSVSQQPVFQKGVLFTA
jgi:hypothetical protein